MKNLNFFRNFRKLIKFIRSTIESMQFFHQVYYLLQSHIAGDILVQQQSVQHIFDYIKSTSHHRGAEENQIPILLCFSKIENCRGWKTITMHGAEDENVKSLRYKLSLRIYCHDYIPLSQSVRIEHQKKKREKRQQQKPIQPLCCAVMAQGI